MRRIQHIISFLLFLSIHHIAVAQFTFTENKGQWNDNVKFKTQINNGAFFLEQDGFKVLMYHPQDMEEFTEFMHGHAHGDSTITKKVAGRKTLPAATAEVFNVRSHAFKVKFIGASPAVEIIPESPLSTYNNYFIGNDKSKWKSDCKIFQAVLYKNVYPNIDVHFYNDADRLKYDIIIRPGGDIRKVAMQYEGTDGLAIVNKELLIKTSVGESKELYPYTYQNNEEGRKTLSCKYVLNNNVVSFDVKGYNPNNTVVIDPTLIFSTFTGSTSDNWGYTATPGPDGSFFAGGIVFGSGYPVSTGAFQTSFNGGVNEDNTGGYDIGLFKFSPDGSKRMYATYIGGWANEQPHSMICDQQGNLTVAGRTNSDNFPTTTAKVGTGGKYDIFVCKLNPTGTALVGSIRIGGSQDDGVNIKPKYIAPNPPNQNDGAYETRRNYGDDARSEVVLDAQGNIILVSCTQSSNFPATSGAFQKTFAGGLQDGVILKFTSNLSAVTAASFFGSAASDACFVVAIHPVTGDLYVAGATTGNNLPGSTTGSINASFQGGITDGFVTIVSPDISAVIQTSYLGTSGNDLVYGIQFDRFGYPYVMGTTTGDWPVINAKFSNAGSKQFIAKMEPDLTKFIYSTVFGTRSPIPNISPIAFLVDRCQNVYVTGWGGGINTAKLYPSAGTTGMTITSDAIKRTTDGEDFYLFVLEKNANSQLFGSFFGQSNGQVGDHVDGGTSRFDANGVIYQAMCANCGGPFTAGSFPTTPNAWARVNPSGRCNEAAVKIEMNFSGVDVAIKPFINGNYDTVGCVPMNITFTDTVARGKKYIWDFGDGTPKVTTTVPSSNYIYNKVGRYTVSVVAIDSSTCNVADTAFVTIRVGDNVANLKFTPTKVGSCESLTYTFDNLSTATRPVFSDTSFIWDFGDGSPLKRAGLQQQTHTFPAMGTYTVKLKLVDTAFCNMPDSVTFNIRPTNILNAVIVTPQSGCAPYLASFKNNSQGGVSFEWDFGDGKTSTEENPTHLYTATGKYVVRLIATDPTTCNPSDTAFTTIEIFSKPTANFNFTPTTPQENVMTKFINTSVAATKYIWDFGDGTTSTQANPEHQFPRTNLYDVCLQAINDEGCVDTLCKEVEAIVNPSLDVPNAFVPDKGDINSVIKVRGFGILKMSWKIYNRWGQKVFESNDINTGWDGRYKGKIQPMDVYTYTLEVEFVDNKKVRRTGDITLVR